MLNRVFCYALMLAALLTSSAAYAYPACTLSLQAVDKKVNHLNAKQLNEWMHANNDTVINKLQDCIAPGEQPWLHIADEILTKSEEDSDDELPLAISAALDINPENVLAEPWPFPIDFVCVDGSDMYDSPYASYEVNIHHSNDRIRKVESVKRQDLQSKVQECVEGLKENQKWIAHLYGLDKSGQ